MGSKQSACCCPLFSLHRNADETVFVGRRFLGTHVGVELQPSHLAPLPHWPSAVGSTYPQISQWNKIQLLTLTR